MTSISISTDRIATLAIEAAAAGDEDLARICAWLVERECSREHSQDWAGETAVSAALGREEAAKAIEYLDAVEAALETEDDGEPLALVLTPAADREIGVDELCHEVGTVEEAGALAASYGAPGVVYDATGARVGTVDGEGGWRAA